MITKIIIILYWFIENFIALFFLCSLFLSLSLSSYNMFSTFKNINWYISINISILKMRLSISISHYIYVQF